MLFGVSSMVIVCDDESFSTFTLCFCRMPFWYSSTPRMNDYISYDRLVDRQTDGRMDRQTDRYTDMWMDEQTENRQTD